MNRFIVMKVNAVPVSSEWLPNTIYYVKDLNDATLTNVYITNSDGTAIRHVINKAEIQVMIDSSLANFNQTVIVADITERNALVLTKNTPVWVLDATGDTTVASGAALYLFNVANSTFIKLSEAESMDVTLNWASIQNKPTSAVADIDDAVARKHSHSNKATLDLLTQDAQGYLLVNGAPPVIAWDTVAW